MRPRVHHSLMLGVIVAIALAFGFVIQMNMDTNLAFGLSAIGGVLTAIGSVVHSQVKRRQDRATTADG